MLGQRQRVRLILDVHLPIPLRVEAEAGYGRGVHHEVEFVRNLRQALRRQSQR